MEINMAGEIKTIAVLTTFTFRPRDIAVRTTARIAAFIPGASPPLVAEVCRQHGIDGVIVIGGDGSFRGAQKLAAQGIHVVGIPGTIVHQLLLIKIIFLRQQDILRPVCHTAPKGDITRMTAHYFYNTASLMRRRRIRPTG